MLEIEIHLPTTQFPEIRNFARHFGCEAHPTKDKFYYRITTDNPVNFFWLGANMNNSALNELKPSAISRYVTL